MEIWSDVVCPWCYVGTRRFSAALDRFDGDVEVAYRAFELDPTVPPGGMDLADYLPASSAARRHSTACAAGWPVGAEVGIDFRWDGKRRVNTFDAHRLAVWAEDVGGPEVRAALEHRLFRAYFTDNHDVSDHAVLPDLAAEVDLDPATAAEALATGAGRRPGAGRGGAGHRARDRRGANVRDRGPVVDPRCPGRRHVRPGPPAAAERIVPLATPEE